MQGSSSKAIEKSHVQCVCASIPVTPSFVHSGNELWDDVAKSCQSPPHLIVPFEGKQVFVPCSGLEPEASMVS